MKSIITVLISFFLFSSCIPLRIAPTIKEDKIKLAKRFNRHLPKQYALIFNDPKDADEFYHFINTKYQLNHEMVEDNVPFKIDENVYSFSFYEVEKTTKTINLIPILIDANRESNDNDPILEELHTSRQGYWYIAIVANDVQLNDCLAPNYKNRDRLIGYLRSLRIEYLNTNNYLEAMLKQQTLDEKMSID